MSSDLKSCVSTRVAAPRRNKMGRRLGGGCSSRFHWLFPFSFLRIPFLVPAFLPSSNGSKTISSASLSHLILECVVQDIKSTCWNGGYESLKVFPATAGAYSERPLEQPHVTVLWNLQVRVTVSPVSGTGVPPKLAAVQTTCGGFGADISWDQKSAVLTGVSSRSGVPQELFGGRDHAVWGRRRRRSRLENMSRDVI